MQKAGVMSDMALVLSNIVLCVSSFACSAELCQRRRSCSGHWELCGCYESFLQGAYR